MMNQRAIPFAGMRLPSSDFNAVKTDLQTSLLWDELDLSTARSIAANTQKEVKYAGNSIYIDKNSDVGNGTIIFQNDDMVKPPRVYVQPGFIARVPWTRLIIENTAQPGKVLRLFYGVDVDFIPGTSADVQISGTVSVKETGFTYGSSFRSTANMAANTAEQVFSAASNVNGAWVHSAQFFDHNGVTFGQCALLAKATAPATTTDGDAILSADASACIAGTFAQHGSLKRAVWIPAGKGLYFISTTAQTLASRSVLYTLT